MTIQMSNNPSDVTAMLADVKAQLREAEAPLRATLDQVNAALAELERERAELTEARRRIEATLRSLDPNRPLPGAKAGVPQRAKGGGNPKGQALSAKGQRSAEYVESWIVGHPEQLAEGFTGEDVNRAIKANGAPWPIGADLIRRRIEDMHERGLIRLDRMARGGARVYKLVGEDGG